MRKYLASFLPIGLLAGCSSTSEFGDFEIEVLSMQTGVDNLRVARITD